MNTFFLKMNLVIEILQQSDMVWPKDGADSITDLAERIIIELEKVDNDK